MSSCSMIHDVTDKPGTERILTVMLFIDLVTRWFKISGIPDKFSVILTISMSSKWTFFIFTQRYLNQPHSNNSIKSIC